MTKLAWSLAPIGLSLLGSACASYTGVSKSPDGQIYISGATNYFVFSSPWIRRCTVQGQKLECEELSESPSKPRGGTAAAGTTSAPAPAAAAPPPAAPPPPAPEPAAPSKPGKRK